MGLIREPLDVDFFVDPRPLTENEKKMISDFILLKLFTCKGIVWNSHVF
jgi:hypothetical protein